MKPKVLDLFSGCGGMSWGLHLAGFDVVGAVDDWALALKTFERNHEGAQIFSEDIANLDTGLVMKKLGIEPQELDVLVGGPPCQGFSKNVPAAYRFLLDPRNQLFREYLRFVEALQPRVVVMENVAELFNAYGGAVKKEVTARLEANGYRVESRVLTATDYGVPQRRRRCFIIASSTGVRPKFPIPTHGAPLGIPDLFPSSRPEVSAWDAISDLPTVEAGEGAPLVSYTRPPSNEYQVWARNGSTQVTNHEAARLSGAQLARYEALEPGQGLKDLPDELRPKSGYSGAYGRLDFTGVAPTITRWVFHPGSGRYGHPVQRRIITMREAARLQSFTDDFTFVGSKNQIAGQIGNAVPPMLMNSLSEEVRRLVVG